MKIKTTQDEYVKSIYLYIYYCQQNSEIKKNKKKNNYMVNDVANEVAQYGHRNNKRYASAFIYIYIYRYRYRWETLNKTFWRNLPPFEHKVSLIL